VATETALAQPESIEPSPEGRRQPQTGVAALERGLSILDAFRTNKSALSLAELAAKTGLYKSTILRLCASLERFGYLNRLEDRRYRLGAAVFPLGRLYQNAFNLRDTVVPVLDALATRTGETASFYVRDGESEVCLHRAASPRPVRDAGVEEGQRFPIDGSACSLAFSAFLGKPGKSYDAIRRDLVIVARPSRRIAGVSALVCPVFGIDQKLVGALLISGPESRFTDETVAAIQDQIVDQAASLTRTLGGNAAVFADAKARLNDA